MFRPDQAHPLEGVRKVSRLFVAMVAHSAIRGTLRSMKARCSICYDSHTSDNLMSQHTTEVHFYRSAGLVDNRYVIYHPHRMHGLPGYYPLW